MMYRGRNNFIISIFVSFVSRGITTVFRLALSGSWSSGRGLGGNRKNPRSSCFCQPCGWPHLLLPELGTNACPGDTLAIPPAVQMSETDALAGK